MVTDLLVRVGKQWRQHRHSGCAEIRQHLSGESALLFGRARRPLRRQHARKRLGSDGPHVNGGLNGGIPHVHAAAEHPPAIRVAISSLGHRWQRRRAQPRQQSRRGCPHLIRAVGTPVEHVEERCGRGRAGRKQVSLGCQARRWIDVAEGVDQPGEPLGLLTGFRVGGRGGEQRDGAGRTRSEPAFPPRSGPHDRESARGLDKRTDGRGQGGQMFSADVGSFTRRRQPLRAGRSMSTAAQLWHGWCLETRGVSYGATALVERRTSRNARRVSGNAGMGRAGGRRRRQVLHSHVSDWHRVERLRARVEAAHGPASRPREPARGVGAGAS